MKTEEQKKRYAQYRKEHKNEINARRRQLRKERPSTKEEKQKRSKASLVYYHVNKDRINAKRRAKREALSDEELAGEREANNARNRKYYNKHRNRLIAIGKSKNWNYNKERRVEIRARFRDAHPGRNTLVARRSKAKKAGLSFELTEDWYVKEWEKGCAVTGLLFDSSGDDSPWVAHIDRIIPEEGYTEENSRLVCACYNLAKKHWTDADVMRMAKNLVRNLDV